MTVTVNFFPLFMKCRTCAIGSHFDTFVPLHGETVLTFPSSFPTLIDLALHFHYIQSFKYPRVWAGAENFKYHEGSRLFREKPPGRSLYLLRSCILHTYTHLQTHARSRNWNSTQTLNITASGQPDWKAHALLIATIGSPMCSAVIKGKLKNNG